MFEKYYLVKLITIFTSPVDKRYLTHRNFMMIFESSNKGIPDFNEEPLIYYIYIYF